MPKRENKQQAGGEEGGINSWLTVSYQPVSLFSLKRSDATSMAARTNLVPTPYAIKMALLKILLETQERSQLDDFDRWIKQEFAWIRDLQILVQPPEKLIVNRNGYKLRYYDQTADKADKTRSTMPLQDGFVFREWVHLEGNLKICLGKGVPRSGLLKQNHLLELEQLLSQINYFGKRGCFFQYLPDATQFTSAPTIQPDPTRGFTVQPMDDLSEKTRFSRINPFSNEKAQLNKDRVIHPGFLPLKLTATSTRYDLYTRL